MTLPLHPLPAVDLRHLRRLTDDTGLYQHAVYATPDRRHGYCIDDNARALIAALYHARLEGPDEARVPIHTYLAFLAYAYNPQPQQFRNFMGYDRGWLEDRGSHDSQGRTLWALGLAVQMAPSASVRGLALDLYGKALGSLEDLGFIRSWAFALLGLDAYLEADPPPDADPGPLEASGAAFSRAADRLMDAYTRHARPDWPWWEDTVTYDNAKLPHALLVAGSRLGRRDMTDAGLASLSWLLKQQTAEDGAGAPRLSVIGNRGWLQRGRPRAAFDQQPLEAYALVDACLQAARRSADAADRTRWESRARMCFDWFIGRNDLGTSLYDPETGGGRDGLNPDGPNQNQGAESSLAYLLSVLEIRLYAAETAIR